MLQIREDGVFTVIVTVDAGGDVMPALREHAATGIRSFTRYSGYIAGALHVSADGTRLVQYLQWESEALYQACIADPGWDDLPSTQHFRAAVASGQATVDARSYGIEALHG